jgi:hypothetical protein
MTRTREQILEETAKKGTLSIHLLEVLLDTKDLLSDIKNMIEDKSDKKKK